MVSLHKLQSVFCADYFYLCTRMRPNRILFLRLFLVFLFHKKGISSFSIPIYQSNYDTDPSSSLPSAMKAVLPARSRADTGASGLCQRQRFCIKKDDYYKLSMYSFR
jgi:hypothetical protein